MMVYLLESKNMVTFMDEYFEDISNWEINSDNCIAMAIPAQFVRLTCNNDPYNVILYYKNVLNTINYNNFTIEFTALMSDNSNCGIYYSFNNTNNIWNPLLISHNENTFKKLTVNSNVISNKSSVYFSLIYNASDMDNYCEIKSIRITGKNVYNIASNNTADTITTDNDSSSNDIDNSESILSDKDKYVYIRWIALGVVLVSLCLIIFGILYIKNKYQTYKNNNKRMIKDLASIKPEIKPESKPVTTIINDNDIDEDELEKQVIKEMEGSTLTSGLSFNILTKKDDNDNIIIKTDNILINEPQRALTYYNKNNNVISNNEDVIHTDNDSDMDMDGSENSQIIY